MLVHRIGGYMLKEALSYPPTDENRFKTFGIAAGLQFSAAMVLFVAVLFRGPVMIVPAMVLILLLMAMFWGYFIRVLHRSAHQEAKLPEFDDWKELGVAAIKLSGIVLGYMSVPLLLLIIEVSFLTTDSGAMTAAGAITYLTARLLTFPIAFLLPVGLTNYALTDRMREAFALRDVINAALTRSYVIAAVVTFVILFAFNIYQLVMGLIVPATISMYVPYLAVTALLSFYLFVVIFSLLGRGCGPHLLERNDGQEATA